MYLVLARSCDGCNQMAVQLLDHKATDEELEAIKDHIGGMFCIRVIQLEVELNKIVEDEIP